jgi:hypothetical protein
MSRTEDLEKQERERRQARTSKLHDWAIELEALAQQLWKEDSKNGWHVRYLGEPEPQLTIVVTINGVEFARFVRDEQGIIGVFKGGKPERFIDRNAAFDATVNRRIALQRLKGR